MTWDASNRIVSTRQARAAPLRLSLQSPSRSQRVVDGGWWPRSVDPTAELPSLVTALNESRGIITRITLNVDAWSPTPDRLSVDGRIVHLDWVDTIDPHLIVATYGNDDCVKLLVVPPKANMTSAAAALTKACDRNNTLRASDILARASAPAPRPSESSAVRPVTFSRNERGPNDEGRKEQERF